MIIGLTCFHNNISDNVNGGRTLTVQTFPTGQTSAETCTDSCFNNGYPLAGMEFADECCTSTCLQPTLILFLIFATDCGLGFENGGAPTPLADCSMPCAGNSSEFCGGPNRLNVRKLQASFCISCSVLHFLGIQLHWNSPPWAYPSRRGRRRRRW